MTLLKDKKDCECDEEGIIWDKDHFSYYPCPQHSVKGSKDANIKQLNERVEKLEETLKKLSEILTSI